MPPHGKGKPVEKAKDFKGTLKNVIKYIVVKNRLINYIAK